jgi:hypothetical protein
LSDTVSRYGVERVEHFGTVLRNTAVMDDRSPNRRPGPLESRIALGYVLD